AGRKHAGRNRRLHQERSPALGRGDTRKSHHGGVNDKNAVRNPRPRLPFSWLRLGIIQQGVRTLYLDRQLQPLISEISKHLGAGGCRLFPPTPTSERGADDTLSDRRA